MDFGVLLLLLQGSMVSGMTLMQGSGETAPAWLGAGTSALSWVSSSCRCRASCCTAPACGTNDGARCASSSLAVSSECTAGVWRGAARSAAAPSPVPCSGHVSPAPIWQVTGASGTGLLMPALSLEKPACGHLQDQIKAKLQVRGQPAGRTSLPVANAQVLCAVSNSQGSLTPLGCLKRRLCFLACCSAGVVCCNGGCRDAVILLSLCWLI